LVSLDFHSGYGVAGHADSIAALNIGTQACSPKATMSPPRSSFFSSFAQIDQASHEWLRFGVSPAVAMELAELVYGSGEFGILRV
jgi:hypothetical protein